MLIAVDGVELTYDEIGNVLTFGSRSFTWNSGRNLASITDGNNTYSYKYDENGIRTSKTVNGVTTYYNTKDGVILSQSDGTNTMYFQYDTSGTPLGFVYNGTQYFYMTNQMGDVIVIVEADGEPVCEYVYNEWGEIIEIIPVDEENAQQVAVANANPLRYRGYYYDTETGYYYLQSRYYDPSICRFINADIPEIAGITRDIVTGTNLFSYCNNDPINNVDYNGNISISLSKIKSISFASLAKRLQKLWADGAEKRLVNISNGQFTLYMSVSVGTSIGKLKCLSVGTNSITISTRYFNTKLGNKKLTYSANANFGANTLRLSVFVGKYGYGYGISIISPIYNTSSKKIGYVSFNVGMEVTYLTLGLVAVTAVGACVVVPALVPAVRQMAKTMTMLSNPQRVLATISTIYTLLNYRVAFV